MRFSSSDPYLKMGYAHPRPCMLTCTRSEEETLAISSVMMQAARKPISTPPYSSGITEPKKPISPMGRMASS